MQDPENANANPGEGRAYARTEPLARLLADDGSPLPGATIDSSSAVALYTQLVTVRALDLRFVELQRKGQVPYYASAVGEEGATCAPVFALRKDDAFFPAPREALAAFVSGVPVGDLVHQVLGSARSTTKGRVLPNQLSARAYGVVTVGGVPGASLPHAAGWGWAAKMRKEPRVALAMVSDNAFSTGDFHNGVNFAGVSKANVVFVCRVDRTTPLAAQTAAETLAEKGEAYGVPAVRVDGRDALAVHEHVSRAVEAARSGKGPTLVEVVTARALPSEDGAVTLPEGACPVALLERHLARGGVSVESLRARIEADVDTAFAVAVAEAEKAGLPTRSSLFDDVYAKLPAHLLSQRDSRETAF